MRGKPLLVTALLMVFALAWFAPLTGCRPPRHVQENVDVLVSSFARAGTMEAKIAALESLAGLSRSLGLTDKDGRQTNLNARPGAPSITRNELAAFAGFAAQGHYRTLGSVIDFLAESGVILASTGRAIDWDGLRDELTAYVAWSYAHKPDKSSMLGLLLASGPGLIVPESVPLLSPETPISAMAAVLLLADVLVGVAPPVAKGWEPVLFGKQAEAAGDVTAVAQQISGLITKIEAVLKPVRETADLFAKMLGGSANDGQSDTQGKTLLVPDIAKQLIKAFSVGNYFAVRPFSYLDPKGDLVVLRQAVFSSGGEFLTFQPAVCLVSPTDTAKQTLAEHMVLVGIPVLYKMRLIAPGTPVGGLYADVDLRLRPQSPFSEVSDDGYQAAVIEKDFGHNRVDLVAEKLSNREDRSLLLYLTAEIMAGDLVAHFANIRRQYGQYMEYLDVSDDDLADMFTTLKSAINVSPYIVTLAVRGRQVAIVEPSQLEARVGEPYSFSATAESLPGRHRWVWTAERAGGMAEISAQKVTLTTSLVGTNYVSAVFEMPGSYTVRAKLIDTSGKETVVAEGEARVVVAEPEQLRILSSGAPHYTNTELPFTVTGGGFAAEDSEIVYRWDFDDDTPVQVRQSRELIHMFKTPGVYEVSVQALASKAEDAQVLATASLTLTVQRGSSQIDVLQSMNTFNIGIGVDARFAQGLVSRTSLSLGMSPGTVTWNGPEFSMRYYAYPVTELLNGRFSWDGKVIEELDYLREYVNSKGEREYHHIKIHNLPINLGMTGEWYAAEVKGAKVEDYVISYNAAGFEEVVWSNNASLWVGFYREDVDPLPYIQQTQYLSVSLRGVADYHEPDGKVQQTLTRTVHIGGAQPTTVWEGRVFSHRHMKPATEPGSGLEIDISGEVSPDCTELIWLEARIIHSDSDGGQREQLIKLARVPINSRYPLPKTPDPGYKPVFQMYIGGEDVASYVVSTFDEHRLPEPGNPDSKAWYGPYSFESAAEPPYLFLMFKTEPVQASDNPAYRDR